MLSLDPEKTRVVLVGASRFPNDPDSLDALPAVVANVEDLKATLTDPHSVGIPEKNITVLLDPAVPSAVVPVVAAAAREAEDALIFYYAGHGLVGRADLQLYLAVEHTVHDHADLGTAVEFNMLRRAIRQSTARKRIVILDCCFSGRAVEGLMSSEADLLQANLDLEGTYTLASSPANTASMAPPGERYTSFTGSLINVLREGLDTGKEALSLDDVFNHLREDLFRRRGLPEPQHSARQDAAHFLIARNRGFRPRPPVQPPADPTPVDLPTELKQAIENPLAGVRRGAVDELARLLAGGNRGLRITALEALETLKDDDSRSVSDAAADAIAAATPSPQAQATDAPPVQTEEVKPPAVPRSATPPVVDTGDAAVSSGRLTVTYRREWGSHGAGEGRFESPAGIAVDESGHVYVADTGNNRIQVFTSEGQFVRSWGTSGIGDRQFNGPRAVAIDGSGNVYVTDRRNNRVSVFTSAGEFLTKWGSLGNKDGQFNGPYGIAVDNSGRVYVADEDNNRMQVFTSDGEFLTKWGSNDTKAGEFDSIHEIAMGADGNLYTSEASWLTTRVQVFSSDGEFLRQLGDSGTALRQYERPSGIAVDPSGTVYVVDTGNPKVLMFSQAGRFILSFGSSGQGNGQLNSPSGVAVNNQGTVFVADQGNNRVQAFTLSIRSDASP